MNRDDRYPVALGGIGGSGTRVLAGLLHRLGYYLGDDLNEALDNIWFTLMFKRRSILVESETDFRSLAALFVSRMAGIVTLSDPERARIFQLAEQERLQHPRGWLIERARSFCNGKTVKRPGQPWAWKEPNTHIVIDRMFACHPGLRYIHVVRHPLDMAVSDNQNQLQNWGPIFLDRDIAIGPRLSLAYWCLAHRRMVHFMRSWPERTLMIDFDALCIAPDAHCANIATLLGTALPDNVLAEFRQFIHRPESAGRFRRSDLGQYDPGDLAYVAELGYPL